MYKQVPGKKYPYEYNGPAKLATGESYRILQEICPYLTKKGPDNTTACCDIGQLKSLQAQIKQANPLLSRCPAALRNFYDLWGEFTCSPDQSNFLMYNYKGQNANVYVSKEFSATLYHSIENVLFPATNGKVLDNMCGVPAKECTQQKFLTFIGEKANGSPFDIYFHIGQAKNGTNITSLNKKLLKCNETYFDVNTGKNSSTCSCQDCPSTCPVPPAPPKPKPKKYIMGLEAHCFWTILTLLIFILAFLGFNLIVVFTSSKKGMADVAARSDTLRTESVDSTISGHYKSTDILYHGQTESKGCLVKLGVKTEKILQNTFRKWGTLCAYNPWKVIVVSVLIVAVLSIGLIRFTVITNPVDLWSSPDSQARQEKNYFDKYFSPFYRTEQVILTTTYNYTDPYKPYQQLVYQNFTGMMHLEILKEVLCFCVSLIFEQKL